MSKTTQHIEKLKPCPFCGGEAMAKIDSMYIYYIECKKLSCTARDTRWFKSWDKATEAWNTRSAQ